MICPHCGNKIPRSMIAPHFGNPAQGGVASGAKLTQEERVARARKAAEARWGKTDDEKEEEE